MKLIYTVGLPASGKSTWAKKYVIEHQDTVRVCRDDLRNMRGIYWLPKMEGMITAWEDACICEALKEYNVIVDATNLNPKTVAWLENIAKGFGAEIEAKVFDTPLDVCIMRDSCRDDYVGEKVIRDMSVKYNFPPKKVFIPIQQNDDLPHAIIVDLDGTLCIHNGRGPFDYDKCDTDLPNPAIVNLIATISCDFEIIYVSGREDSCKRKTLDWIKRQGIVCGNDDPILFMRKTGDRRADYITKKEIFEQNIKDQYYVEFCLDDRKQVVDLWRSMGLTCLQVAESFD